MKKHLVSIILIFGAGLLAYFPGLTDFMIGDDFPNIVNNPGIQLTGLDYGNLALATSSNDSGPLGRPLANLSFGLNYYFSGQQIIPSHFKLTNLIIHLLNGLLVYLIAIRLFLPLSKRSTSSFPTPAIALFVALIWMLHPIQLTSVLYSVQRMNSMAALFSFAGLLLFLYGRSKLTEDRPHAQSLMYGGIISGTLLGALCKENALLLPFLALVVEATLFNKTALSAQARTIRNRFYLITVIIPIIAGIMLISMYPDIILKGYDTRNFTLGERLMTEARVIFYYLRLILYPDLSQLSLYHDDIAISRSLLSPWTTLPSIAAILTLSITAVALRKKYQVLSFMVLWFFIGHAMESSIIPLEIAYEHRNYLPSLGIAFGVIYYLFSALSGLSEKKLFRISVPAIIIFSLLFVTYIRAEIWSEEKIIAHFAQRNHPDSVYSRVMYAKILMTSQSDPMLAYEQLRVAARLNTNEIAAIIGQFKWLKAIELNIHNLPKPEDTNLENGPAYYFSPLYLNQEYISKLLWLLNQEITLRLNNSVDPTRAALTLRGLSVCITQGQPNCTAMISYAIDWFELALKMPNIKPRHSSSLHISYARLNAYTGNIDNAFTNLNESIAAHPDDLYAVFEKIRLYITLQDWSNAASLLKICEQRDDLSAHHKTILIDVKELYKSSHEAAMNFIDQKQTGEIHNL